jgi:hypothetical protein
MDLYHLAPTSGMKLATLTSLAKTKSLSRSRIFNCKAQWRAERTRKSDDRRESLAAKGFSEDSRSIAACDSLLCEFIELDESHVLAYQKPVARRVCRLCLRKRTCQRKTRAKRASVRRLARVQIVGKGVFNVGVASKEKQQQHQQQFPLDYT